MEKVPVPLPGGLAYDIFVGRTEELRGELASLLAGRRAMTVADGNTAAMAGAMGLADPVVIPAGERSKTFASAAMLCGEAARRGLDRKSVVVALGGGVIGDLAGFAAAIYMRGIRVVQIPTSLLAMVDSSVGGKTAVDLAEGKNLVGAFHQPSAVLIAPEFLRTLPMRERIGALAEVVKYGFALDREFFGFLETHARELAAPEIDPELFGTVIRRSCGIKARIVVADEKESGVRKYLNYGHSCGHAVELLSDFQLSHGEAVAIGMRLAAKLAVLTGRLAPSDADRQDALLGRLGLPAAVPDGMTADRIVEVMRRDKKNTAGRFTLVLPTAVGAVECVEFPDDSMIRRVLP